jgi:hypothetical protein
MKQNYITSLLMIASTSLAVAQFPKNLDLEKLGSVPPNKVIMPKSPLKTQVVFVGGSDMVETNAIKSTPLGAGTIYGQAAGKQLAKQWHDFIGFTAASREEIAAWKAKGHENFLGWISVNHEMVIKDDKIGDGGGMTVFAIKRDVVNDSIVIVPQTLKDGRSGKFMSVDFVNTVGETGMNCGGIQGPDGRIWTAEEWFRTGNGNKEGWNGLFQEGNGIRDTADFTIKTSDFTGADFNGKSIKKFQNLNWMVEVDPREAKAIRKQYNWGRQGFEGGVILSDNKTVFIGEDMSPGLFTKFVADVAGDFTKGKTYVYKHDAPSKWVEIDNSKMENMLDFRNIAIKAGVTVYNRLEWCAYNKLTGKVYVTETGADRLSFKGTTGVLDNHWVSAYKHFYKQKNKTAFAGTDAAAIDSVMNGKFPDYYGRVLEFDPITNEMKTLIEGGPYFATSPSAANYPKNHLASPDGLGMMYINGKAYLLILEDLIGRTFGRVPLEYETINGGAICEMYLLDLSIVNPTVDDLVKIMATPLGAEITGSVFTDDYKTLFVNSQHPSTSNPFPFNNSLTMAISGWENVVTSNDVANYQGAADFKIWPNPTSKEINLENPSDIAIYNNQGIRIKIARDVQRLDISDLSSGIYYITNKEVKTLKLVVE